MPPSTTVPISQIPQGIVPTIAALRLINTTTMSDGDYVRVLGSGTANDGWQQAFVFSGASTLTDNGITVVNTSNTGSWIRMVPAPYVTALKTASYSGVGENFILVSGGATQVVVTLPPSYTMYGQEVKIKSLSTGAFQIQATGLDSIFPTTGVSTVAFQNFQNSGAPFTSSNVVSYRADRSIWYQA